MYKFITKSFVQDEDGAVSVDWVVLSAAIVGLAVGTISTIQDSTVSVADNVSDAMEAIQVGPQP